MSAFPVFVGMHAHNIWKVFNIMCHVSHAHAGMLTCFWCDGSGKNSKGVEEIMGNSMENIIPRNGVVEVRWNLLKGGPCFLCQGRNGCIVGCPDCQGTGIVGYVTKYKE